LPSSKAGAHQSWLLLHKLSHRDLANRNRVAGTAAADLYDFMCDNLTNRIIAIHQRNLRKVRTKAALRASRSSSVSLLFSSKQLIGIGGAPAASKLSAGKPSTRRYNKG
jgi:hypothetical protein